MATKKATRPIQTRNLSAAVNIPTTVKSNQMASSTPRMVRIVRPMHRGYADDQPFTRSAKLRVPAVQVRHGQARARGVLADRVGANAGPGEPVAAPVRVAQPH